MTIQFSSSMEMIQTARASGGVSRCHTHTYHGSYTLAQHSWQIITLGWMLMPEKLFTVDFIMHAQLHDAAELVLGDLPAPAKWRFPELAAAFRKAEATIELEMLNGLPKISDDQRAWLKALDLIELSMWAIDQITMGNYNVVELLGTCVKALSDQHPPDTSDLYQELLDRNAKVYEGLRA